MDSEQGSTDEKYPKIPRIPKEILEAINNNLVIFLGAGISGIFGLPMWNNLATKVLYGLHEEKRENGRRLLPYSGLKSLEKESNDPRRLLSILYESCEDKQYFYSLLQKHLTVDEKQTNSSHELIDILGRWNSSIVTTNYDTILDDALESGFIIFRSCKNTKIPEKGFDKPYILHLHGSILEPDDLVITVAQYHTMYHDDKDPMKSHSILKAIFENNIVLFIGYSLKDYEILEYTQKGEQNRFFALIPFIEADKPAIPSLECYYNSVNVKLLPYFIDENGYLSILDVLRNWEDELNRSSTLPVETFKQVNQILLGKPNTNSISRLMILLGNYSLLEYFIKQLSRSEIREEWIICLLDTKLFDASNMIDDIRNGHEYSVRLRLIVLVEVITNNLNNKNLRTGSVQIIKYFIKSENRNLITPENYYTHKQIVELITTLIDDIGSFDSEYLEQVIKLSSHNCLAESIIDHSDSFIKCTIESKTLLLKLSLEQLFSDEIQSTDYQLEQLTGLIENGIEQQVLENLFETIISIIVEKNKNQTIFGYTIGSVEDYLQTDEYHDNEFFLIKWYRFTAYAASEESLKNFVKNNIASQSYLLRTISLYAINIHFEILQDIFWNQENYSKLNYSELYDLISNNCKLFDNDKKAKFIECVQNSYNEYDPRYARNCRYNLLALLPHDQSNTELENRLKESLEKNHDDGSKIHQNPRDRGKQSVISFGWSDDVGNPDIFDSIDSVIEVSKQQITFQEEQSIVKYLEKNIEEIIEKPTVIDHLPIQYLNTVCCKLENYQDKSYIVFNIFSRSISIYIENELESLSSCIYSMKIWAINNNKVDLLCEKLLELIKQLKETFCNAKIPQSDRVLVDSMTNWYTSILWVLLNDIDPKYIEQKTSEILPLIDDIRNQAQQYNIILIDVLLASRWGLIDYLDSEWAARNVESVLCNKSSMAPAAAFLSISRPFNKIAFDMMYHNNTIIDILNIEEDIRDLEHTIDNIAAISVYAYSQFKNDKYLKILKMGLESPNCEKIIYGSLKELNSHDKIDESTHEKIIQTLIDNMPKTLKPFHCLFELVTYLENTQGLLELKLSLMLELSKKTITHLPNKLINKMSDYVGQYCIIEDITLNLSHNNIMFYNEEFKQLVESLSNHYFDKNKIIKICNIMIKKGHYEYLKIEKTMK